ncbi:MAG: sulfur carrier protein ThiS [Zetaproteobacteria bacterium]|nr:MAG: sulfur carrier protein ThiS [Zetaproteobacteria bacterium]
MRKILLNGEEREVGARTLQQLVGELGLRPRMIAIERNLAVVPRSRWEETELAEGDRIEIVQMIGGG